MGTCWYVSAPIGTARNVIPLLTIVYQGPWAIRKMLVKRICHFTFFNQKVRLPFFLLIILFITNYCLCNYVQTITYYFLLILCLTNGAHVRNDVKGNAVHVNKCNLKKELNII